MSVEHRQIIKKIIEEETRNAFTLMEMQEDLDKFSKLTEIEKIQEIEKISDILERISCATCPDIIEEEIKLLTEAICGGFCIAAVVTLAWAVADVAMMAEPVAYADGTDGPRAQCANGENQPYCSGGEFDKSAWVRWKAEEEKKAARQRYLAKQNAADDEMAKVVENSLIPIIRGNQWLAKNKLGLPVPNNEDGYSFYKSLGWINDSDIKNLSLLPEKYKVTASVPKAPKAPKAPTPKSKPKKPTQPQKLSSEPEDAPNASYASNELPSSWNSLMSLEEEQGFGGTSYDKRVIEAAREVYSRLYIEKKINTKMTKMWNTIKNNPAAPDAKEFAVRRQYAKLAKTGLKKLKEELPGKESEIDSHFEKAKKEAIAAARSGKKVKVNPALLNAAAKGDFSKFKELFKSKKIVPKQVKKASKKIINFVKKTGGEIGDVSKKAYKGLKKNQRRERNKKFLNRKAKRQKRLLRMIDVPLEEIQKALGIEDDGKYGSETFRAIVKFQKDNKLARDGLVGPKTWEKIKMKKNISEINKNLLNKILEEEIFSKNSKNKLLEAYNAAKAGKQARLLQKLSKSGDKIDVKTIQQSLMRISDKYTKILKGRDGKLTPDDGDYGRATHDAIVQFQKDSGYDGKTKGTLWDGLVGPFTFAKLREKDPALGDATADKGMNVTGTDAQRAKLDKLAKAGRYTKRAAAKAAAEDGVLTKTAAGAASTAMEKVKQLFKKANVPMPKAKYDPVKGESFFSVAAFKKALPKEYHTQLDKFVDMQGKSRDIEQQQLNLRLEKFREMIKSSVPENQRNNWRYKTTVTFARTFVQNTFPLQNVLKKALNWIKTGNDIYYNVFYRYRAPDEEKAKIFNPLGVANKLEKEMTGLGSGNAPKILDRLLAIPDEKNGPEKCFFVFRKFGNDRQNQNIYQWFSEESSIDEDKVKEFRKKVRQGAGILKNALDLSGGKDSNSTAGVS